MCFSATASFGVATVLAGVGTVSVARKEATAHRLLAATPLLFAIQQAAEGVVWLTLNDPNARTWQQLGVALFMGVAVIVWPTWMPLSLLVAESNPRRRRILRALVGCGVAVSTCAGWILVGDLPTAEVSGHSIVYSYTNKGGALVLALYLPAYILPSVLPFFVSTMDKARTMGGVLVASLLATFLIQREALTSVWCFFAAVLSGLIVLGIAAEYRLATRTAAILPLP